MPAHPCATPVAIRKGTLDKKVVKAGAERPDDAYIITRSIEAGAGEPLVDLAAAGGGSRLQNGR